MKFIPKNIQNHLNEGEYMGKIEHVFVADDEKYIWFEITVQDVIFKTSLAINSDVFNHFAFQHVDENGEFDTDDLVGTEIDFSVKDKQYAGSEVFSRIVKLDVA